MDPRSPSSLRKMKIDQLKLWAEVETDLSRERGMKCNEMNLESCKSVAKSRRWVNRGWGLRKGTDILPVYLTLIPARTR